jgi:hypothetical protein
MLFVWVEAEDMARGRLSVYIHHHPHRANIFFSFNSLLEGLSSKIDCEAG